MAEGIRGQEKGLMLSRIFRFLISLIFFVLTVFPLKAQEISLTQKKTILGQPLYLLAEQTLSFPENSFRQVWEACLGCLHKLNYKLTASTSSDDEHIILARKTRPSFRFMGQTQNNSIVPNWNWLSADVFYLQVSVTEEVYGVVTWAQLGTDRLLESRSNYERRAERMLNQFVASLKQDLKEKTPVKNPKQPDKTP